MNLNYKNSNQTNSFESVKQITDQRAKTPFKFSFSKSSKDQQIEENSHSSTDILATNGYFYFGNKANNGKIDFLKEKFYSHLHFPGIFILIFIFRWIL